MVQHARRAKKKIKASPSALYDRLTLERRRPAKEKSDLQIFFGFVSSIYLMDENKKQKEDENRKAE
jgi:hypothetical protein